MKRLILSALLFATFAVREAPAQPATGVDYNAATPAALRTASHAIVLFCVRSHGVARR